LRYALGMTLSDALTWVIDNKEWIFSGVGAVLLSTLIMWLLRQRNGVTQGQSSGANSTNVQAGRDISVGRRKSESDDER
jgi:hypothetical protein